MLNKDDWDRAEILLFGLNDFNDKENMSIIKTNIQNILFAAGLNF